MMAGATKDIAKGKAKVADLEKKAGADAIEAKAKSIGAALGVAVHAEGCCGGG